MNKKHLKESIIAAQKQLISELKEKIDSSLTMVDIDETDTIDPEDLSHQSESLEIKNLFEQKLNKAQIELDTLIHMDFSEKKEATSEINKTGMRPVSKTVQQLVLKWSL